MTLDPDYDRDMDEIAELLNNYRQQHPILNPSRRQPHIPTTHNDADIIERYIQEDGHRTWGIVVYRCTYKSDEDWAEFIRILQADTEHSMRRANGLDILDRFRLTVFEDRALEGASISTIREKFRQWATTASQEEQGTGLGQSQRYQYCIMVDEAALESCVRPATEKSSYAIVIHGPWKPRLPRDDDELEETYEPLEGCTLYNVGWIKGDLRYLVMHIYYYLGRSSWSVNYQRPPEIVWNW